jgi:hypothetical protein
MEQGFGYRASGRYPDSRVDSQHPSKSHELLYKKREASRRTRLRFAFRLAQAFGQRLLRGSVMGVEMQRALEPADAFLTLIAAQEKLAESAMQGCVGGWLGRACSKS